MKIKCKIKNNSIEITYKNKTYNIDKDKLIYVFEFLDEIKICTINKGHDFKTENDFIEKLKEYSLLDEAFLENINNIW